MPPEHNAGSPSTNGNDYTTENNVMEDKFAGADNMDQEDLSGLDFGNDLEPAAKEPEATPDSLKEELDNADDKSPADAGDDPGSEQTGGEGKPPADTDDQGGKPPEGSDTGDGEPKGETETGEQPDQQTEPERKKRKIFVPKDRLDAEMKARQKFQKELQDMQNKLEESKKGIDPNIFKDALELAAKGESAEAAAKLQEAMALQMGTTRDEAVLQAKAELQALEEESEFNSIVSDLESEFDFYDTGSDNFDQAFTDETIDLQKTYIQRGYSKGEALRKAANMMLAAHKPELIYEDVVETKTPEKQGLGEAKPEKTEPKKDPKAEQVRKDKVDAANRQPPRVQGEKQDDALPDVSEMTESDFDALPASVLARMRGDFG